MKTCNIAAIPGEGIVREAIAAGIEAPTHGKAHRGQSEPAAYFSVNVRTDAWVRPRYRRAGHSQSDRPIPDGSVMAQPPKSGVNTRERLTCSIAPVVAAQRWIQRNTAAPERENHLSFIMRTLSASCLSSGIHSE